MKQTTAGRRVDAATELRAWRMTFKSGFDYLKALPAIGIAIDERHAPARHLGERAWRRLGDAFLADRDPEEPVIWAEREFGAPARQGSLRRR